MDWRPNVRIPGQRAKAAPALSEYDGQLHMVHLGASSNDIWHSMFDGQSWSTNVRIPGQRAKASPALAVYGGKLHMVHLGASSNDIWHSAFDGHTWSAEGLSSRPTTFPNIRIPDQASKAAPTLSEYDGLLHMVHLGDSSNDIWHSVLDPRYVRPRYELWVNAPTVTRTPEGRQIITARGGVDAEGTDPESAQVTLRLRRDIRSFPWIDENLAQTSRRGVDVTLDVEYECPGGTSSSEGTWNVFAEVMRAGSKKQSGRTKVEDCRGSGTETGEFTHDYMLERQVIDQGIIPYALTWDPGPPRNAQLLSIQYPDAPGFPTYVMSLWKPTAEWSQCGSSEASITLREGQATTAADLDSLFGSSTPAPPLAIVACIGSLDGTTLDLDRIPVRIRYRRD